MTSALLPRAKTGHITNCSGTKNIIFKVTLTARQQSLRGVSEVRFRLEQLTKLWRKVAQDLYLDGSPLLGPKS